jgi:c-di-GMP-binding flagellar brake protein YcgR
MNVLEGSGKPSRGSRGSPSVAERRRHRRFIEEVRVRYRDLEGVDPSCWGRTRNLSLGGLYLVSESPVPLGSHLAFEIHIQNETAPVLALGRVVRTAPEQDGHAAGVEFLWVSQEDRANLSRLALYFRKKYGETGALDPDQQPPEPL